MSKVLYIEGTKDDTNGDLREGFRILLEQRLKNKMPHLVMSNSKAETMSYFENRKLNLKYKHRSVMVDSDAAETAAIQENIYFMIQEMEAWFLSQPQILDECFGIKVSVKIPKGHASNIGDPSGKLLEWTRTCKTPYHKVRHGVKLLKKLNLSELENKFPDVKRLVETLSN